MAAIRPASGVLDEAIDWMVHLRSGEADAADIERHRGWCAADVQNAAAWTQVQGAVQGAVMPLLDAGAGSRAAARSVLERPPRRRAMGAALGFGAVALTAAWTARHRWPAAGLLADLRTGTGERRNVTLADGSRLQLNAGSAVDVDFRSDRRVLRLRAGELIVQVAPEAQRPFSVLTAEGEVQALGTRFLVRQESGRTLAMVLQHSVAVRTMNRDSLTLQAGQAAYFSNDQVDVVRLDLQGAAGWERGMLVANDQPLSEVIDALRPYRAGFIRLSPQAGNLRVLGAFPLDDSEQVLESLAQTLPIRLTHYGGWLVTVELRS